MNSKFLLRFYRKRKKITQNEISKLLNVCERQYRRYEQAPYNITFKTFQRIVYILELSNVEKMELFKQIMIEMEEK